MEHRITIVDDEGEVRSALRRLFKVAGMKTESYASAEEFLDAPSDRCCDCLIPDHGLPGMSGLELQSRLAAEMQCSLAGRVATAHDKDLFIGAPRLRLRRYRNRRLHRAAGLHSRG